MTDSLSIVELTFISKDKAMKAILWDGSKQINGELILDKKRIQFRLSDFGKTDLDFDLAYKEVVSVSYFKLYENINVGIEILSDNNRSNIFIVDSPKDLKRAIEVRRESFKH